MREIKIRDLVIGKGRPKICVPIVARTEEQILSEAEGIADSAAELVEWRADYCENLENLESILKQIRERIGERPLLFTFRTAAEGGERSICAKEYSALNQRAAESKLVDLIDVEAYFAGGLAEKLICEIHERGGSVIASYHDFHKTPPEEELVKRMYHMQQIGADIAKLAVMPENRTDVLTLMRVTEQMGTRDFRIPLVTMSMGKLGVISRISGELTGSSITFGALGQTSAPGQLEAGKLQELLELLSLA